MLLWIQSCVVIGIVAMIVTGLPETPVLMASPHASNTESCNQHLGEVMCGFLLFFLPRCASTGWLSASGTTWTGQKSATTFAPACWWAPTTRFTCAWPRSSTCSRISCSRPRRRSCSSSSRWAPAEIEFIQRKVGGPFQRVASCTPMMVV